MENSHLPSPNNRLRHFQNLLTLSALTLIITVWATVLFLEYDNFQLKKYTQNYQTTNVQNHESSDTSNWKTYSSAGHKISFKYPSKYFVNILKDSSIQIASFGNELGFSGNDESFFLMNIKVIDNPDDLSEIEYLNKRLKSYEEGNASANNKTIYTKEVSDKIIDSFKYYNNNEVSGLIGELDPGPLSAIDLVNSHNNKIYLFHLSGDASFNPQIPEQATKTFHQILSTFEFIDTKESEGIFCGGIAGLSCPEGYSCKLDGNYPDAGGDCVKN